VSTTEQEINRKITGYFNASQNSNWAESMDWIHQPANTLSLLQELTLSTGEITIDQVAIGYYRVIARGGFAGMANTLGRAAANCLCDRIDRIK